MHERVQRDTDVRNHHEYRVHPHFDDVSLVVAIEVPGDYRDVVRDAGQRQHREHDLRNRQHRSYLS